MPAPQRSGVDDRSANSLYLLLSQAIVPAAWVSWAAQAATCALNEHCGVALEVHGKSHKR